jgi:uncharacterized membrane protein required for colicin V production
MELGAVIVMLLASTINPLANSATEHVIGTTVAVIRNNLFISIVDCDEQSMTDTLLAELHNVSDPV